MGTDGSGYWPGFGPVSEIVLEMGDLSESDVMSNEVGHEWIIAIVMLEGFIDLGLKRLVSFDQGSECFFSELKLLNNVELEVSLELFKDGSDD